MEALITPNKLGPPEECRVFIAHVAKSANSGPLTEFADVIIPIQHRWVFPDEVQYRQCVLAEECWRAIDQWGGFRPDKDYLALIGDPLISAVIISEFTKKFDSFTILRYDRKTLSYFPMLIRNW